MSNMMTVSQLMANLAANYEPGDPVMVQIDKGFPVLGTLTSAELKGRDGKYRLVLIQATSMPTPGSGR